MSRKIIKLTTEKDYKIAMDPLRQRIMRKMQIIDKPLTAKNIADHLKITPSSAKYHLTQLESIGAVEVDHTEKIHGITAVFYVLTPCDINIGLDSERYIDKGDLVGEKFIMGVYKNFVETMRKVGPDINKEKFQGESANGIMHLTQKQADTLIREIRGYIEENSKSKEDTDPYEFAFILYNAKESQ